MTMEQRMRAPQAIPVPRPAFKLIRITGDDINFDRMFHTLDGGPTILNDAGGSGKSYALERYARLLCDELDVDTSQVIVVAPVKFLLSCAHRWACPQW